MILCVINIINVKSNIKNASLTIQSLDEINKSKKGAICYGLIPPSIFFLSMIVMKILKEHSTKSDFVISSLTMILLIGGDGVIKLFLNYFGLSLFFKPINKKNVLLALITNLCASPLTIFVIT